MPWSADDAKKFTSRATTPKKRWQWAKVANVFLKKCLAEGGKQKGCEAGAIRAANAAIKEASKSMEEEKQITTNILKRDDEKRLVYGVVLVPDEEDKQGDIAPAEVIEAAAHEYLAMSRTISRQHKELAPYASVVESYIAPCRLELGGVPVLKGSWLITVKILNEDMWQRIRSGEYGGFSVGGLAEHE